MDQAARFTSGTIGSATSGAGMQVQGNFNVWINVPSAFVGTAALERTPNAGTTWYPVTWSDGTAVTWTAGVSVTWAEPESGVSYRVRCTAYTSGSFTWRISQ